MMLNPPEDSGDQTPGLEFPCPECCSVWWLALVTVGHDAHVRGFLDRVRCANCQYELELVESET